VEKKKKVLWVYGFQESRAARSKEKVHWRKERGSDPQKVRYQDPGKKRPSFPVSPKFGQLYGTAARARRGKNKKNCLSETALCWTLITARKEQCAIL